jgi:hypothetical protein
LTSFDLLLQPVPFGAARDFNERGHPVKGREDVVQDRTGLDVPRPADNARRAHAAFPGAELTAFEGCGAAVRVALGLGAIVGGEDDDGVVELAHVLQLLEHVADIVVHLLHAGFVDAPVLAAFLTDHIQVLGRQHGGDVHARRVVPDEERLVGLLGIVAIEEVDDLGRNLLVHCLRSLQRQRTLIFATLVRLRAVGRVAKQHRTRGRQASCCLGVNGARNLSQAADGRVLARWRKRLLRRGLVDVGEAHLLFLPNSPVV